jgi:hypothetical protein
MHNVSNAIRVALSQRILSLPLGFLPSSSLFRATLFGHFFSYLTSFNLVEFALTLAYATRVVST